MQNANRYAERPLDSRYVSEQGIVEPVSSTQRPTETSDHVHLSVEMAIEWAHLGGD
jgi:hypothetical protein